MDKDKKAFLIILAVTVLAFLTMIALPLISPAKALAFDPVVNKWCAPRPYCGGPGQIQMCAYPVRRIYCEEHYASGAYFWYWVL